MAQRRPKIGSIAKDIHAKLCADVADQSQLRAHILILATRSRVFAEMLKHNIQEASNRLTVVNDLQEAVLKQLLQLKYCAIAPQLETMSAELLTAADKYDLPVLKKRCEETMARYNSVDHPAPSDATLHGLPLCPQLTTTTYTSLLNFMKEAIVDSMKEFHLQKRKNEEALDEILKEIRASLQGMLMATFKAEKGSFTSDMCGLLSSDDGADVTLVTGEVQLRAHSQILAARSPVFAAMLKHNMQEARSRTIVIADVQGAVLKELLYFIYCDTSLELETMSPELLTAADKYDLPLLKSRCEETMARNISVDNAALYAGLSVLHSCPRLKINAADFIRTRNKVMGTDGWAQLLRTNAETAVEICKQLTSSSQEIGEFILSQSKAEKANLASDMRKLLDSGDGADVTLVTGQAQLRAHSQILAARSPVFAAMLKQDMQEASSRFIEVPDLQEAVLKQLLNFIYCDTVPQLKKMAPELLAAADKYDLPLLTKRCEETIATNISIDNAASYVALSVLHSCSQLKTTAANFITSHSQVMGTDGWAQLLRTNPEAAVEICKQVAASSQQRDMIASRKYNYYDEGASDY